MSSFRIDFTENKLFTLSKGTQTILKKIKEPIELHFFLSESLTRDVPGFASYGRRVRELLNEIANKSNNKIKLHTYNPIQYSVAEDQANVFGIQAIPIDDSKRVGYFGLAAKTKNGNVIKRIEFFQKDRESHLEYDIVYLIYILSKTKKDVIGVMSSLPIMGDTNAQMQSIPMIPWEIIAQLRTNFDLLNLPQTIDDIPKSVNTLMVVHPTSMNARAIYALEQYLFRGGKAIFFIDPNAELDRNVAPDKISSSTQNLQKLFETWGISVPKNQLIADRTLALRVNAGTAIQPIPAEYLAWLGVQPQYIAQDDPVTNQIPTLNLATVGYIKKTDNSPLTIKPLILSSKNSALIPALSVAGTSPDIIGLLERFQPDNKDYVIAARLQGNVQTSFQNAIPVRTVAKSTEDLILQPDNHLTASAQSLNIILIADSDLLQDRFWIIKQQFYGRTVEQQISGNGQLVLNALENLTGNDELLGLRGRGSSIRPFEKVEQLKQSSQIRLQGKQRELQEKVKQTQQRINELEGVETIKNSQTNKVEVTVSLTPEQRREIEKMRTEMFVIRQQLRNVQLKLREDVVALENWLQFINIGLIPILIALFAILLGLLRRTQPFVK